MGRLLSCRPTGSGRTAYTVGPCPYCENLAPGQPERAPWSAGVSERVSKVDTQYADLQNLRGPSRGPRPDRQQIC